MQSRVSREVSDDSPDNVYYNIGLVNNSAVGVPCIYQQTLPQCILDNSKDYYCSCVRFSLDGSSMPIFLFQDDTYYVAMSYNGSSVYEPVVYVGYPVAGYYPNEVYTYQSFLNMINTAYADALTALTILQPGIPVNEPPYMLLNSTTGLISLYAQTAYATDNVSVFMNQNLYYFFYNLEFNYFGEGLANKQDYQILIYDKYGSNTSTLDPSVPTGYYKMQQEYPSPTNWFCQSAIVFKSTLIGLRPEFTPTSNTSTTSLSSSNSAGIGAASTSQMTDFVAGINSSDAAAYRSQIVYVPTSQYRLIDITVPCINKIDVSIYFRDKQNNEYVYMIPPLGNVSIKLLFTKKSLYKNTLNSNK